MSSQVASPQRAPQRGAVQGHRGLLPLTRLRGTVLPLLGGGLGGLIDTAMGHDVGHVFAGGLSLGAALAVLLVERRDVLHTVIWVPLMYGILLLAAAACVGGGLVKSDPGGLNQGIYWLLLALAFKAPVVLIATAAAILVALGRLLARR